MAGQGQFVAALEEFRTAAAADPALSTSQVNLGLCLMRLNRHSEATAAFDSAIRLDPGSPFSYYQRALLRLQIGDLQGSRNDLERAIPLLAPEDPLLRRRRATPAHARTTAPKSIWIDSDAMTQFIHIYLLNV